MRYPTDIFFGAARAASALLDGAEGEAQIGTEFAPVITLPGPIRRFSGFDETVEQQASFFHSVLSAQPASAAILSVRICTFGRGLWELELVGEYERNVVLTPGNNSDNITHLFDTGAAVSRTIFQWSGAANVPVFQRRVLRLLLTEGGFAIFHRVSATGVGETAEIFTSVLANRLL